ncbi:MAG: MarR family transcriptional regulator [Candidatus Thorarchaeota archaeon]|nr:MAG: MarR family transcriptional regulator [Candidatus Thorarchaeota archaeon]
MMSEREGGFLVTQIHHLGRRVFSELLKERGLEIGPGQGRILFALWQKDGEPINALIKKTLLRKSTLSELLDSLEKAGHVKRVQSAEDKRKVLVKLTEKTRQMLNVYIEVSQEMTKIFYRDFEAEEIDEFEAYLKRVLENLVSQESQ